MDIKNVLVADEVAQECLDLLEEHGIKVTVSIKLTKELLMKEIPKYDGLIVRSDTKVTDEIIASAENLKVIGRAGAGVDNIDVPAATTKNILVLNAPGGNSISACELTCGLIINLARHVTPAATSLKNENWKRKDFFGEELFGKTLAVIGLGRIGLEVALRMKAWGMRVIGYDPIVTAEEVKKYDIEHLPLEKIWPLADYITVHTPLVKATKDLINAQTLYQCKQGVRIINVARGGIINEKDLLYAIIDKQVKGAALDVYEKEPPYYEVAEKLIQRPEVLATPHLGACTGEAQKKVAVEIAEQFVALAGKSSKFSVNGIVNREVYEALNKK